MNKTATPSLPLPALLLLMSAAASAQVSPVDVGQLPLNTRNLSALTALTPEVQPPPMDDAQGISSVLQAQGRCATVGGEGCPGADQQPTPPSGKAQQNSFSPQDDDAPLSLNSVRPSLGGGYANDVNSPTAPRADSPALGGADDVGDAFLTAEGGSAPSRLGTRTAGPGAARGSNDGIVQGFRGFSAGGSSYLNGTNPDRMTATAGTMLEALNEQVRQTNQQQAADVQPMPDRTLSGQ